MRIIDHSAGGDTAWMISCSSDKKIIVFRENVGKHDQRPDTSETSMRRDNKVFQETR